MRKVIVFITILCWTFAVRAQDYKTYQNYDFVPEDRIVFEDDFRSDMDGEFPAHWKLLAGQAVVNKFQGEITVTTAGKSHLAPKYLLMVWSTT